MIDYADKSNEEMASWFIASTCQLVPKSFSIAPEHMHNLMMSPSPGSKEYSIVCGSFAEFYIRPLNTCIGDIDFLMCQSDELVFSGIFPAFPRDMSGLVDTIKCYKIESYDKYPGFVRLRSLGEMIYDWKYKKYHLAPKVLQNIYIMLNMPNLANSSYIHFRSINASTLPNSVCGPAIKTQNSSNIGLESDVVRSLFCPQWPTEAKHWPIRPRKYGWPTTDAISEVVLNGCHVVYVQHRSCRNDREQWRLSFSLAEVILLQSWSQTQQIVYHLLRFFAKRELIQKDCSKEDEVLCPYHLKTLTLWTCEVMSPEWWDSSSIITICCDLLKMLSDWLKSRYCPNYFIPEANLFHEHWSPKMLYKTERRLTEFHNSCILCHWFVEKYILPITRTQFQFLNTGKVEPDFLDYVLPLLDYRETSESEYLDFLFSLRLLHSNQMCRRLFKYGLSGGLGKSLTYGQYTANLDPKTHSKMTCLPTTEKVLCFKYHRSLLYMLYTADALRYGDIAWDSSLFVELVHAIGMQANIIKSQYHNFPKTCSAQSSWFQFLRALDLMQNLTGSNSHSEFQLLSLMSKEFLRQALEYKDFISNDILQAASAYLAALNFATSEYQQAIRFCMDVLADQTSYKENETLNAGCLLFIDDVARLVGLHVLHMKITDNNLHCINSRLYLDLRLSPEVFAHYLTVLSTERISKQLGLHRDFPDSAFPMDEYLKALIKPKSLAAMKLCTNFNVARQTVYRRTDSLTQTEATNMNPLIEATDVNPFMVKETVIGVLMEYALENMTSFYRVISKNFGIQCNTADCYGALYLYKCRQYDEVLLLCERILHESDLKNHLKELSFANILLMPPFFSYFDTDIQSLLGVHTLFCNLSPLNDEMRKFDVTDDPTFSYAFVDYTCFSRSDLLSFLPFSHSAKCPYFFGRHFLAGYLKLRCCIDCNLPYAEAMTEFAAQKTNFPFEHIIRGFLLQKLRVIKQQ